MYCDTFYFMMYAFVVAFINFVFYIFTCDSKGSAGIRTVSTFFGTVITPIISFAFENNPLIEAYTDLTKLNGREMMLAFIIFYPFLYICNLGIFKISIGDWREEFFDDIIKKLNGSDPYFMRVRNEILKKCGNNTLDWGIKNLSTRKCLKLAFKSFILDLKTLKETVAYQSFLRRERRKLINAEKTDLKRKKRFLDTADI